MSKGRKKTKVRIIDHRVIFRSLRGHLEAGPAHMARSRSYRTFNTEADALADSLSKAMPNRDSEEIVSDLRR